MFLPLSWATDRLLPGATGLMVGASRAAQDQPKGVQQSQASHSAFAATLGDGSVVTWDTKEFGGDSCAVQDQLKGVQQIQTSQNPFAAILSDASVVTWGREI